jgi:predicted AlkP superfamily phosphohydrolase/phosphomutase
METERAFVLGLDGVAWPLLQRWTDAGELPTFARLREEGAAGPLATTIPDTVPAWASVATGRQPDRHGVYGDHEPTATYGHQPTDSGDIVGTRLWDVLAPVVVANVPGTFPARAVDGLFVAGPPRPAIDSTGGATHPPALAADVREAVPDYGLAGGWGTDPAGTTDRDPLTRVTSAIEAQRRLLDYLRERQSDWRCCCFGVSPPAGSDLPAGRLLDYYRLLDELLADLLSTVAAADADLFVVSPVGRAPVETVVNVNTALEQAGLLSRATGTDATDGRRRPGRGLRRAVRSIAERAGLEASRLVERVPGASGSGPSAGPAVDHAGSAAFCYGPGLVYVNDTERFAGGRIDPDDVPAIRRRVATALTTLRDPTSGERALRVQLGTGIFPDDPAAPDLVVRGTGNRVAEPALGDEVFAAAPAGAAGPAPGTLLGWGPDIQPGATTAGVTTSDIAPTLLHVVGEAVPRGADGHVCWELLDAGAPPASRRVRYRRYDHDDAATRDNPAASSRSAVPDGRDGEPEADLPEPGTMD